MKQGLSRVPQARTPSARLVTTDQQIRALQTQPTALRYVKNCGDERIKEQVSGIIYDVPPGEILPIPPRLVHPRAEKTDKILLDRAPVLPVSLKGPGGGTPNFIVAELLKRAGRRGLTEVFNDESDAEREALAATKYYDYRRQRAEMVQNNWMQKVRQTLEDNPTAIPPVMPDQVKAEIVWLRENATRTEQRRAKWIALDGAFESDDRAAVEGYVQENWPDEVEKRGGFEGLIFDRDRSGNPEASAATGDEPESDPAAPVDLDAQAWPATGGAPPATPRAAAPVRAINPKNLAFLRQRAEALGLEIDNDDWEAIEAGDALTISRVTFEITQAG